MQANQSLKRLQDILSQEPEETTWNELIDCLDNWSDFASLSKAIDFAEEQLTSWYDFLRTAPIRQWQAVQDGVSLPSWWKLIRRLNLGENDNPLDTLAPEVLENITSIELEDDCVLSPAELRFLASLNKLNAVYWFDLIVSLEDAPEDESIDDILDAAEQQLTSFLQQSCPLTPAFFVNGLK